MILHHSIASWLTRSSPGFSSRKLCLWHLPIKYDSSRRVFVLSWFEWFPLKINPWQMLIYIHKQDPSPLKSLEKNWFIWELVFKNKFVLIQQSFYMRIDPSFQFCQRFKVRSAEAPRKTIVFISSIVSNGFFKLGTVVID